MSDDFDRDFFDFDDDDDPFGDDDFGDFDDDFSNELEAEDDFTGDDFGEEDDFSDFADFDDDPFGDDFDDDPFGDDFDDDPLDDDIDNFDEPAAGDSQNDGFRTLIMAMGGLFAVGIILIILLVVFNNFQQGQQNTAFQATSEAIELENATREAQIAASMTAAIVGQTQTLEAQLAGTQTAVAGERGTEQAQIQQTATGAVVIQTETQQAVLQSTEDAIATATQSAIDQQSAEEEGATQTAVAIELTLNPVFDREPLLFNGQPVQTGDGSAVVLIDDEPFVIVNDEPIPVAPGSALQTADGQSVTFVNGSVVLSGGSQTVPTVAPTLAPAQQTAIAEEIISTPLISRQPATVNGETVRTNDGRIIVIVQGQPVVVDDPTPEALVPDTPLQLANGTPVTVIDGIVRPVEADLPEDATPTSTPEPLTDDQITTIEIEITSTPSYLRPPIQLDEQDVIQTSDGRTIVVIGGQTYVLNEPQAELLPPGSELRTENGESVVIQNGVPVIQTNNNPMPTEIASVPIDAIQQTATALAQLFDATPTQDTSILPTSQLGQGGGIATSVPQGTEVADAGQGGGAEALPDTGLFDDVFGGSPMAIVLLAFGLLGIIIFSRTVRSTNKQN